MAYFFDQINKNGNHVTLIMKGADLDRVKIYLNITGGTLIIIGVYTFFSANEVKGAVITSFPLFAVAVICLAPSIASPFAELWSTFFYPMNGGYYRKEYSDIKALIAREAYEEAANRLEEILEKEADQLDVLIMLNRLLLDKLKRPEEALTNIENYFEKTPKLLTDHEALINIMTDACLEMQVPGKARDLLNDLSQRTDNLKFAERIRKRADSLPT